MTNWLDAESKAKARKLFAGKEKRMFTQALTQKEMRVLLSWIEMKLDMFLEDAEIQNRLRALARTIATTEGRWKLHQHVHDYKKCMESFRNQSGALREAGAGEVFILDTMQFQHRDWDAYQAKPAIKLPSKRTLVGMFPAMRKRLNVLRGKLAKRLDMLDKVMVDEELMLCWFALGTVAVNLLRSADEGFSAMSLVMAHGWATRAGHWRIVRSEVEMSIALSEGYIIVNGKRRRASSIKKPTHRAKAR